MIDDDIIVSSEEIKVKISRSEYFNTIANDIIWKAMGAKRAGIIDAKCDSCPSPIDVPNPYYEGKFLCAGECDKYGLEKPISIDTAKKIIIEALDRRT